MGDMDAQTEAKRWDPSYHGFGCAWRRDVNADCTCALSYRTFAERKRDSGMVAHAQSWVNGGSEPVR